MGPSIEDRFENILDHLICNRVVPFVGAGISHETRVQDEPDFRPSIKHLTKLLRQSILCRRRKLNVKAPVREHARSALGTCRNQSSFGRLAEVGQSLMGRAETCKAVNISNFAALMPDPSHYALACLALEGLIDEIISTNWDCCIEKAIETLTCVKDGSDSSSIRVITDLDSYRRDGARRRTESGGTILKLFKINGCAKGFSSCPDDQHAEEIIMTERQLQDFGVRSWARDMLKDRVRSRTMLFSGFGSDEPQVRHTVLQLLDEFSQGGPPSPDQSGDRAIQTNHNLSNDDLEHTLFMITFANRLSFNQWQIVNHFCLKRSPDAINHDPSVIAEEINRKIVSGKDAKYFGATDKELRANVFWCALFDAANHRLVRDRYSSDGSEFNTWLTINSRQPEAIRAHWLSWLFPQNESSELEDKAFRCAVPGLFGPKPKPNKPLPDSPESTNSKADGFKSEYGGLDKDSFLLGRWLLAMEWNPAHKSQTQTVLKYAYCPLAQGSLLSLATLFVLFLLARISGASESGAGKVLPLPEFLEKIKGELEIKAKKTSGLRIQLPSTDKRGDSVFLVARGATQKRELEHIATPDDPTRIRWEIEIPRRLASRSETRIWVERDESSGKSLIIGRRRRINAEDLVRKASEWTPASLLALFASEKARTNPRRRLTRIEALHG